MIKLPMVKDSNYYLQDFGIHDPLRPLSKWDKERSIEKRKDEVYRMKRTEVKKFDVTPYVGERTKIASAEIIAGKYGEVLKVETEVIPFKGDDSFGEGKTLTASMILGLQKDDDGTLSVGIDTKTDKWLTGKKINVETDFPDECVVGTKIEKLVGLEVVCQKNDNGFLEIA